MEKLFTLLVFVVIVSSLSAQSGKWSYGLSVQGGYSGESIRNAYNPPDEQLGGYSSSFVSKLQPSAGAGIWVERALSKRWGIHIGLDYMQLNTYNRSENTNRVVALNMVSYTEEKSGTNQEQLQTPISIRFYFGQADSHWRPFISGGMQAAYLLRHTNYYYYYHGVSGFPDHEWETIESVDFSRPNFEFKRLQFALTPGIGIQSNDFRFSIQHSWAVGNYETDYSYMRCGNALGLGGCYNQVSWASARLLQQTSVRVQYSLK